MPIVPAPRPCISCPYRRDVPSGVWDREEYEKLPAYDATETWEQPPSAFFCHQQDGRLCAGWVAVHDMEKSCGLRIVAAIDQLSAEEVEAVVGYRTDVPLFSSGAEACEHGLRDVDRPSSEARELVARLGRKLAARDPF